MKTDLALFGGSPIVHDHNCLRISWPIVSEEDRNAVLAAFDRRDFSGRSSAEVQALEEEMAHHFGMPFGTALNSGTAALHAALSSLEIAAGDEVIVPNFTFIAVAMAVVHNGSVPVFADIDRRSYNISAETIRACITSKTKAVIVVHMHGRPVDLDPIFDLCRQRNIVVIEDVAQSPGARYKGRLVGGIGDAAIFSLMGQKNLATCGECGVLLSRTREAKNRAERLRIYGEILRVDQTRSYNSYTLGWNYTLNPIQAAMARTQLRKFAALTQRVREAAIRLTEKLRPFGWVIPPDDDEDCQGVYHFYRFGLDASGLGYSENGRFRMAIQHALDAEGLNVRHYQNCPISHQPVFKTSRFSQFAEMYDIARFPAILDTIRSTLVLGAIGASPAYLLCNGTIDAYLAGFEKIHRNIQCIIEYAASLRYTEPWDEIPKTSDSQNALYEVFSE